MFSFSLYDYTRRVQKELKNLLSQCVSFETISGNSMAKQECSDWLIYSFLSHKNSLLLRGHVHNCPYVYLPHSNAKLLWFCHYDVVPGKKDQFTVRFDSEKAYGRGVKDMKGASIPFLLALREAIEKGRDPPVSVLLTSDEETAGTTIPELLSKGILSAPVAFTPDTGSTTDIVTKHKGVVWAELISEGRGAHAAIPWEGTNPIPLLADALSRIANKFPPGTENDWKMTVNPTMLQGSGAQNQIPDRAVCLLDIRFPPEDCNDSSEALKRITEILPAGCRVHAKITAEPLYTDASHPMVQLVKEIAEEVTGEDVSIGREHGATDARYFSEAGIPAFLYGPIGGGIHGAEEWVSLKSLEDQYLFNKKLLQRLEEF